MVDILLKRDPEQADEDVVVEGLRAFNVEAGGPSGYEPIALLLMDDDGQAIGGLTGWAGYDWLFVKLLHVPGPMRGQGWGRELMNRAEIYAREAGLVGIWLDTFEFQARGFYEKLGFSVFGTLEDHPLGSRRYFLSKRFESQAPTA